MHGKVEAKGGPSTKEVNPLDDKFLQWQGRIDAILMWIYNYHVDMAEEGVIQVN